MSSEPDSRRGLSFGARLTLWYAFVFIVATATWFYAVYYLIDDSLDKEWAITRSRIVATWTSSVPDTYGELELTKQHSLIEGSVPGKLSVASHFRLAFIKIALPIIALGLLGGWGVARSGLRPLRDLGRTVRHILSTGRTSARVPVGSDGGELNELVGLFNQMLDRNDSLMGAMRESLDNVAHDLHTPMTRLRGAAETALQQPGELQDCREALKDCMEESERVLTMLNTLMDVAEAETGAMNLQSDDMSVTEVVCKVVELYDIVAEEHGVTVVTDIPEDAVVYADRIRLRQILANLLDNAIKYSREGQSVTLAARSLPDFTEITVSDHGLGIPAGEIDKIWDRLYRGDLSRTRRGLGLGLSFVKALVEAHGGTVRVKSELNRGSQFILELPRHFP